MENYDSTDDSDFDCYYQSDSSEEYGYYLDNNDHQSSSGDGFSLKHFDFKMYKGEEKVGTDTYGEIEGTDGEKAKVCFAILKYKSM